MCWKHARAKAGSLNLNLAILMSKMQHVRKGRLKVIKTQKGVTLWGFNLSNLTVHNQRKKIHCLHNPINSVHYNSKLNAFITNLNVHKKSITTYVKTVAVRVQFFNVRLIAIWWVLLLFFIFVFFLIFSCCFLVWKIKSVIIKQFKNYEILRKIENKKKLKS